MSAVGTLTNLRYINFIDTNITDTGLEQLSSLYKLETIFLSQMQTSLHTLSKLTNLKNVVTLYSGISDQSLFHLSTITKLERLTCQSATKLTGSFLPSLTHLKELTHLSLGPNIKPKHLSLLSHFTKLNTLDIHSVSLSWNEVRALATLTRLRFLNLSGNSAGFEDSVLFYFLSALTKLEYIDFGYSKCRTQTTLRCLERLTKLWHLDLENTQITDKHLSILLFLTNLEDLILAKNSITNESVANYLIKLPNLKHLNISDTEIDKEGIISYLSPIFFSHLQSVDLSGIELNDDCLIALAQLSTLTALTISGSSSSSVVVGVGGGDGDDDDANYKISNSALQHISQLTRLQSLTWTDCANISQNGVGYFSCLVNLRTLFLSLCEIDSVSITHLSQCLTNLIDLRLIECSLNDHIVSSLTSIKHLQRLFLDSTQITDKCVDILLSFKHLKTLSICGTALSKQAKYRLTQFIPKVIKEQEDEDE
jgi:hypothetical protein